jgi:hypothetical protein
LSDDLSRDRTDEGARNPSSSARCQAHHRGAELIALAVDDIDGIFAYNDVNSVVRSGIAAERHRRLQSQARRVRVVGCRANGVQIGTEASRQRGSRSQRMSRALGAIERYEHVAE